MGALVRTLLAGAKRGPVEEHGCYGCFGPVANPNMPALTGQLRHLGMTEPEVNRVFATFNAASPGFASGRGE